MLGWVIGAAALGSIATVAWIASSRGDAGFGLEEGELREDCTIAIWLLEVDRDDPISVLVNETTGAEGFSHAVLDACEKDAAGKPLVIDCHIREGIQRVRAARYAGRKKVRINLDGPEAWEIRGCARARVGASYDVLTMLWPEDGQKGLVCSDYLYRCMPRAMREKVDGARRSEDRGAVSPNQIARAFGIANPMADDVTA